MEDETIRVPILKFVVLKSERNWYIKEDNDRGKEAKEINKNLVKDMTHEEYKNKHFEAKQMRHRMKRIQSYLVNSEYLKLTKFLYHDLVINDIYLMMGQKWNEDINWMFWMIQKTKEILGLVIMIDSRSYQQFLVWSFQQ